MDYTIDELITVCISRQVIDGEVLAQGINTPLVMAGYILAKLTHAPNVHFASAIGQSLCQDWGALGIASMEGVWLERGLYHVGFATASAELLPKYNPKEFFRPAQVDAHGNTNNVAFGRNYHQPRLRLPGTGGIPDVTPYSQHVYLYVPRHSRVTFVEKLDFLSGLGHNDQRIRGQGPHYLISDLGEFDWHNGRMRLTAFHPRVSIEQIIRKTGFELEIAESVKETTPPTPEEISLLREKIDPLSVRKLETLSGSARKQHLFQILEAEGTL